LFFIVVASRRRRRMRACMKCARISRRDVSNERWRRYRSISFESFIRVVSFTHAFEPRPNSREHPSIMKVARTKAQLKHLKTKRKKAKEKRRRRRAREDATGGVMSMLVDEGGGSAETGEMGEGTSGGVGGAAAKTTTTGGRARQSDRARRKRELRDRISELKSKRSKIGKKNFGKSEERKRLTMMIKELERERAGVCADEERGGGGGEDEDDAMMDAE
jgi:hypothetical protein